MTAEDQGLESKALVQKVSAAEWELPATPLHSPTPLSNSIPTECPQQQSTLQTLVLQITGSGVKEDELMTPHVDDPGASGRPTANHWSINQTAEVHVTDGATGL